jgi:hypothetical protein
MYNFLCQDIGINDIVYIGERQGSHGRKIGIVTKMLPSPEIKWVLELDVHWKKISKTEQRSVVGLVKLPDDTMVKLLP